MNASMADVVIEPYASEEDLAQRAARAVPTMAWDRILWLHVGGIGAMHLSALAAPFTFTWSGLVLALALWVLVGGVGVCFGYHRLLTHRSFKAPRWLTYIVALLGTFSWQGSPIAWVGKHRLHHRFSDRDGDPHSPRHGLWWSHVGWVFFRTDVDAREAAKDLARDPFLRALDHFHAVSQPALAGVLYFLGEAWDGAGVSWVVWGVCVRTVFCHHATWCVNSAGHRWGYRTYETSDDSRNNWWVALLTFGEGWHNNHHASPSAAAHGRRWFELDLTYLLIRALAAARIVTDVRAPRAIFE